MITACTVCPDFCKVNPLQPSFICWPSLKLSSHRKHSQNLEVSRWQLLINWERSADIKSRWKNLGGSKVMDPQFPSMYDQELCYYYWTCTPLDILVALDMLNSINPVAGAFQGTVGAPGKRDPGALHQTKEVKTGYLEDALKLFSWCESCLFAGRYSLLNIFAAIDHPTWRFVVFNSVIGMIVFDLLLWRITVVHVHFVFISVCDKRVSVQSVAQQNKTRYRFNHAFLRLKQNECTERGVSLFYC